jgi:hypothetical protein
VVRRGWGGDYLPHYDLQAGDVQLRNMRPCECAESNNPEDGPSPRTPQLLPPLVRWIGTYSTDTLQL